MSSHFINSASPSIQADTPRQVAEIVAGELRKLGCPITPQTVDFIEAEVEAEVARFHAAERFSGVVRSQLETPLRALGKQFEQMARDLSPEIVHGR